MYFVILAKELVFILLKISFVFYSILFWGFKSFLILIPTNITINIENNITIIFNFNFILPPLLIYHYQYFNINLKNYQYPNSKALKKISIFGYPIIFGPRLIPLCGVRRGLCCFRQQNPLRFI